MLPSNQPQSSSAASSTAALETWALPRLQQLLPLDDDSLRQVLTYTLSLSKSAAAEHLKDILGDAPSALEFIASFNLRRQNAPAESQNGATSNAATSNTPVATLDSNSGPAVRKARPAKKKPNIHALPARQVTDQGNVGGAYVKSSEADEYMPRQRQKQMPKTAVADRLALTEAPGQSLATGLPLITGGTTITPPNIATPASSTPGSSVMASPSLAATRAPPSAAGPLVSDMLVPKKANSRKQSPAPKATVNIAGGKQMRGASGAMSDLESAIRTLELQTNPTLRDADDARRKCDCMATRHPLLEAAPNCLNCGQIICIKQGLGPCTFCGTPLLTTSEINAVLRALRDDERGVDRSKIHDSSLRSAESPHAKARTLTGREFLASTRATPISSLPATPSDTDDDSAAATGAKAHRDRLLAFQAENARRTTVHDEAADFDIPTAGTSMWASPSERAAQLKKQQRVMREMQWNARPEWEKRRVVASIDVHNGKVVRKMAAVARPTEESRPPSDDEEVEDTQADPSNPVNNNSSSTSAFSHNPLAKGLVRPQARESKGKERDSSPRARQTTWRRVQMDEDDNELWILDGGARGGLSESMSGLVRGDEPECG